ncbi:MAG: phosphoribosylformylglycinamidine cyclo-ligase [Abitibacteriaceae bacterium]|nr:phosphoribosylformylglycinamidine cyclo-ligase [Abditibacteriaceae bacterium]
MESNSSQATPVSTYASAGVNIEAGNETVRRIKPYAQATFIPGVIGGIGGFGALFQPDLSSYSEPIFVSGTDSVGTKLKVAFALDKHDTIGIDCVAMNANDVLCCGARPLFFLDYLGIGKLEPEVAEAIIKGVADGCQQAGCALIGGETAELPGLYAPGEYDLVGFCVGMVDKPRLIDGSKIIPGDVILGLSSSGVHSNGYSLARKVLEPLGYDTYRDDLGTTVGESLLTPTRIYVRPVLSVLETVPVKGIVHITGGGFYENIPRVLPTNIVATIERGTWPIPPIFTLIQQQANIDEREMYTTFNMGIGMVLITAAEDAATAQEHLAAQGVAVQPIGTIGSAAGAPHVVLEG